MPRSSETVAALASALAKAQAESRQPGKVPDGHDPDRRDRGWGAQFPLCGALKWTRR